MNILKTLKTFVIDFDSLSSLIYLETYRNQIHILINFRTFFDCVEKVVEGHSLDENEILDVEQSRLVGVMNILMNIQTFLISEWVEATWPPSGACGVKETPGLTLRTTSWSWTLRWRGGGASGRSRSRGWRPC